MTDAPVAVTFPAGPWIPNPQQIQTSARVLLATAGAALDQYGNGEDYERRVLGHGETPPILGSTQKGRVSQLVVTTGNLFVGQAGAQQFQYVSGAIGKFGQRSVQFFVLVFRPWIVPKGQTVVSMGTPGELEEVASKLWQDGFVVWSALCSLAMRGTVTVPLVAPIVQDNVLVGPMTPEGPNGGMAGYRIEVIVQL